MRVALSLAPGAITSFSGEHRFLSNFAPCDSAFPLVISALRDDGMLQNSLLVCFTVEHAFQASKTLDPAERRAVARALTPGQAKRLGRRVTLRSDWNAIRVQVMRELLAQKFYPGRRLAEQLLATGDVPLIEGNTWGDTFWGVCVNTRRGENHLGRLLMEQREALRDA